MMSDRLVTWPQCTWSSLIVGCTASWPWIGQSDMEAGEIQKASQSKITESITENDLCFKFGDGVRNFRYAYLLLFSKEKKIPRNKIVNYRLFIIKKINKHKKNQREKDSLFVYAKCNSQSSLQNSFASWPFQRDFSIHKFLLAPILLCQRVRSTDAVSWIMFQAGIEWVSSLALGSAPQPESFLLWDFSFFFFDNINEKSQVESSQWCHEPELSLFSRSLYSFLSQWRWWQTPDRACLQIWLSGSDSVPCYSVPILTFQYADESLPHVTVLEACLKLPYTARYLCYSLAGCAADVSAKLVWQCSLPTLWSIFSNESGQVFMQSVTNTELANDVWNMEPLWLP